MAGASKRLRPYQALLRQGMLTIAALLVPVFSVLYFFTIPEGPWVVVVITHAIATAVAITCVILYFRVAIWVDEGGITERGYFGGRNAICAKDIGSIVLVHTYAPGSAETTPQLFVCNHEGTQVVRMRGQFWSPESMKVVRETLDVPLVELSESVTVEQLLDQYPGLLYWFERRPVLAAVLFSAVVVIGGVLLYLGLLVLGISPR
jgi:hypothetical protein